MSTTRAQAPAETNARPGWSGYQGTKEIKRMTTMSATAICTVRLVAKRFLEDEVGTCPAEFGGGLGMD